MEFRTDGTTYSTAIGTSMQWAITGVREITLTDGCWSKYYLYFNAQVTGFYCSQAGQRAYREGAGYASPDKASAPTRWTCRDGPDKIKGDDCCVIS